MTMVTSKLLFLDCDSTLSAVEGVDELARLRGPGVLAEIEAMTKAAMEGLLPVEAIFEKRLELIRPTQAEVAAIAQRYLDTVEPQARAMVNTVTATGWTPIILSGGFRPAIQPLAAYLGVEQIEAVDLYFDEHGQYRGFDRAYPTTRSGGKPEVIRRWQQARRPERCVMVGDGVSDLEAKPLVDLFVGFGGYAVRDKVQREASAFVTTLADLPALLA